MIGSKEEFDRGLFVKGRDGGDYYSGFFVEELKQTIDALGEVARAAKVLRTRPMITNPSWIQPLDHALARIEQEAPWLLEDQPDE